MLKDATRCPIYCARPVAPRAPRMLRLPRTVARLCAENGVPQGRVVTRHREHGGGSDDSSGALTRWSGASPGQPPNPSKKRASGPAGPAFFRSLAREGKKGKRPKGPFFSLGRRRGGRTSAEGGPGGPG